MIRFIPTNWWLDQVNFYIVVEGLRTEKIVFSSWIPLINPSLTEVQFPAELDRDKFVIVSGSGYPNYLTVVRNGAIDVTQNPHYGHLVISIDAEDDVPHTKSEEVAAIVNEVNPHLGAAIVVQNACIESWFLGNRRSIRQFPISDDARAWRAFYDVWSDCPELMPGDVANERNRAQTAFAYLVSALRDRAANLRYSKQQPNVVCHQTYLERLRVRADDTGHLESFQSFVQIF